MISRWSTLLILLALLLVGCREFKDISVISELRNSSEEFVDDIKNGTTDYYKYYNTSSIPHEDAKLLAIEAYIDRMLVIQRLSQSIRHTREISESELRAALQFDNGTKIGNGFCFTVVAGLHFNIGTGNQFTQEPRSVRVPPNGQAVTYAYPECRNR